MNDVIILSIVILGVIGLIAAVILYLVAQKFKVDEDERIGQIVEVLPGANCGGCGFPGCQGFATACTQGTSLEGKFCPVGGAPVMEKVAAIMGMEVCATEPKVAVVRCNGTCQNRAKTNTYDGAKSCKIAASHYSGDTGCGFGCLGLGDCVAVCTSDAIKVNPETGIVEVDENNCTGCGACAKACPKGVIELRNKGPKGKRVYVGCINKDKGAVAKKACSAACIGCGKCAKVCPFEAITVENNVAYIDFTKCKMCRKCVVECPTGAIKDVNFPMPAPKPKPAEPKPAAEVKPEVEVKPIVEKPAEVEVKKEVVIEAEVIEKPVAKAEAKDQTLF